MSAHTPPLPYCEKHDTRFRHETTEVHPPFARFSHADATPRPPTQRGDGD